MTRLIALHGYIELHLATIYLPIHIHDQRFGPTKVHPTYHM
jgi:hypothetical protein